MLYIPVVISIDKFVYKFPIDISTGMQRAHL